MSRSLFDAAKIWLTYLEGILKDLVNGEDLMSDPAHYFVEWLNGLSVALKKTFYGVDA